MSSDNQGQQPQHGQDQKGQKPYQQPGKNPGDKSSQTGTKDPSNPSRSPNDAGTGGTSQNKPR